MTILVFTPNLLLQARLPFLINASIRGDPDPGTDCVCEIFDGSKSAAGGSGGSWTVPSVVASESELHQSQMAFRQLKNPSATSESGKPKPSSESAEFAAIILTRPNGRWRSIDLHRLFENSSIFVSSIDSTEASAPPWIASGDVVQGAKTILEPHAGAFGIIALCAHTSSYATLPRSKLELFSLKMSQSPSTAHSLYQGSSRQVPGPRPIPTTSLVRGGKGHRCCLWNQGAERTPQASRPARSLSYYKWLSSLEPEATGPRQ